MIQQFGIKVKTALNDNWYPLTAYMLFLLLMLLLVQSITNLDRGLHFDNLRALGLLAAVFGVVLSSLNNQKNFTLLLVGISLGWIAAFTIIGNLAKPFLEFLQTFIAYFSAYWQYAFREEKILPTADVWQEKWALLMQAIFVLLERLGIWLGTFPEPNYDPVSLNLVWGFAVWLISLWLYWFLVKKKQVLAGLIPLLIIIAYTYQTTEIGLYTLVWVLGIGLFIKMLANQSRQEDFWEKHQFSFSELTREQTRRNAVVLSIALVFFAGAITSPKLDEYIEEFKERRNPAGNGTQASAAQKDEEPLIERAGPEKVMEDTSLGQFPNTHLVGSGPELQETEVMHVRIEGVNTEGNDLYYLRSSTYATYTVHGWLTANKGLILQRPDTEFEVDFTENQNLIYQEVTLLENAEQGNLMYTVGELATADVNYYSSYHTKFLNNTYTDLFASVTTASEYTAYSIIPYFGESELRNSSLDYPDWITNKYLQIPEEVPDRVYDLALRLTATQPTPYDRALAIEQYLRQFEYSLDLPEPPYYYDVVDYFIFDLQKGYCDYFSTSMVVLARAAGLPARFVTGYIAGTYDAETGQYVVTADQAHSWVEVYFPEYGWVIFEPTPGRPALERVEERELIPENSISEEGLETPAETIEATKFPLLPDNLFVLIGQLSVFIVVIMATMHWVDRWALQIIAPERMFARLYQRLRKMAKRSGVKIQDSDTPLEFSALLVSFLTRQGIDGFSSRFMSSTPQTAELIIAACNQAAYEQNLPDDEEIRWVISAWGQLRWQLLLLRLLTRLKPIGDAIRRV